MDDALRALLHLHAGLPRKGPSSDRLVRALLAELAPHLPARPRAADLGCGSGPAAILLAETLAADVTAVDASALFIDELRARVPVARGNVEARLGDMLVPGIEPASLDLIWCEGAAYAVGVEQALAAWRPLLRPDGFLVFSECCWIASDPPAECAAFWADAYPAMTTPAGVVAMVERHGYRLRRTERLAPEDWWASYYDPLAARCAALDGEAAGDPALAAAIAESRQQMDFFRRFARWYGYVLFVLDL
jgi:serine/threonine-protein kinase HipA